jgi:formylglycine-generating enzyme required for sulfatase activity
LSFNPSADIYSLGATMVKMLTGETPPICPTILEQGGLDLSKIKNPRLAEACRFAMQPRTKDRPQSIDEFLDFIDGRKNLHHVEAGAMCSVVPCEDVESLPNKRFVVNGVAFEMVQVKGGKFFMGATQEQAGMAYSEELPAHEVTLTDYWIGQTQVTQKLWMAVMGSNPSSEKGDDLPVETVSFDDCCLFIQRLNLLTGASFRLPTEAEWEFAARGGLRSQGYQFAGSDTIDDVAWYWRNSGKEIVTGDWNLDYLKNSGISTRPVAMKAPNELGLYDMCGNVWEWCSDFYAPYTDAPVTNPKGAEKGDKRTFRGGGWNSFARYCRVSHRYECPLKAKSNSLGLRLAMG